MKNILILLVFLFFALPSFAQNINSKSPQPGPAPEINLGKYESFKLENGLKVFVIENHKLPKVSFYLIINRPPLMQGNQAGYIEAVGRLVGLQTKTETKNQIDQRLDFIGAKLKTFSSGVFASTLKNHTGELLKTMSEIVMNSVFTQTALNNIKKSMKSELERQQNDPQAIINVVSDVLDYGKDFPYGIHPTEVSIDSITLTKCNEYYSTYFRPNISDLAIVGDMTLEEAKSLTEKYFGSWEKSEIPKIEYKIPQQPDSTKVILVDRPNSTRVDINVTYPVLLKIGSDDVIKSAVMNTILGAENFRLFDDLTKEHKYAYGVFSNLSQDEYVGNFTITTSVKSSYTDSTISQILYEMKKIRNSQVSEEELQKAKNYLIGNFALALEQPQTVAAFIVNLDKYNLSSNYYTDYLKNTSQVTKQDVQNEAEKYIKPNNAYIVVVGNADQISDGLKQFGSVYLYDKDGNKIGNTTIEIPKGLTGEKVIDNYINALGGKINLDKVKDRTTIMTGNVRGREITMTIYQKAPDKMKQDILAGPYNQDVYFDGVNGIMKVADKTLEVKGAELEKLKYESTLDLLTHIDSLGIKLKLEGTANVAGKNAYKVAMIFPSGTKWIQYYAADTWLKIKESKNISVPQGTFTEETYMGDYHEVDGVKYPFSLKQSIGSQQLNFTVSSIKINTGLSDSIFVIK